MDNYNNSVCQKGLECTVYQKHFSLGGIRTADLFMGGTSDVAYAYWLPGKYSSC